MRLTLAGLGIAFLMCLAARHWWVADLFTHWVVFWALAAIMLAGMAIYRRQRAIAVLALLLTIAFLAPLPALYKTLPLPPGEPKQLLRIIQWNVLYKNEQLASKGIPWLLAQDADVIILQEVNAARAADLEPLKAKYPWHRIVVNPKRDAFGMAIFSRLGVERYQYIPTSGDDLNHLSYFAIRTPGDFVFHLYEAHLYPPVRPSFAHGRNADMQFIASMIARDDHPFRVLLGDFNCSRLSPHMTELIKTSGLHASAPLGSWPHFLPAFLRIGIDQLLTSPQVVIVSRQAGPYLGSDHLPVISQLVIYRRPARDE